MKVCGYLYEYISWLCVGETGVISERDAMKVCCYLYKYISWVCVDETGVISE